MTLFNTEKFFQRVFICFWLNSSAQVLNLHAGLKIVQEYDF